MEGTAWISLLLFLSSAVLLIVYVKSTFSLRKMCRACSVAQTSDEVNHLRLQAMLASIGDGVVATDKDGNVIFLNQVAQDMLSWTPEMISKPLSDVSVLADENGKAVPIKRHPLHRCLETGKKIVTKNYHFILAGKYNLAVYISATPIINQKKEVVGAIEVFRDITKEKEIDKAKSEFVYLASHQLRTPLSTINWYLELLLGEDAGKVNSEQKEYLQEAYDSTKHMVALVNEILDVSRLELGTLTVKYETVDVRPIIADCTNEVAPMLKKKEIKLVTKVPDPVPLLTSDPKLIRIIFQNLMTNAVKYTPEKGAVRVTMELSDHQVSITVADTGFGIPKNVQDKVFSKLFRADNIKEREPSGTGLGLYTVKSVVEQLGGSIRFESEQNKGTTFFVILPLKSALPKTSNAL